MVRYRVRSSMYSEVHISLEEVAIFERELCTAEYICAYLQRAEEHHLLLRAVNALVENLPLGLLVDQVDPDGVAPGVEVIEGVELEPEEERVKVPDSLFHQRQRGVEPPAEKRRGEMSEQIFISDVRASRGVN